MQRLVLLVCGICIPLIQCLHVQEADTLKHVEPVLNFRINGHNEGPNTIDHGHEQPHADEVEISFSAFNQEWNFVLHVDHGMFSPTSRFRFHDETGEHTTIMPDHTLYKTKADEFPWASVNILHDKTIHAMIGTKEDTFTIDPAIHFPEFELSSKMGMYRASDVESEIEVHPRTTRSLLQAPLPATTGKDGNPRAYTGSKFSTDETAPGIPTKWTADAANPCYPNQAVEKKFAMGFAVTNQYYRQANLGKGTTQGIIDHLKQLLADSNSIYAPQMGVHLYIETTDIRTVTSTAGNPPAPWNLAQPANAFAPSSATAGCRETASTQLGKLRTWRQQFHANDAGLWHLMTTCFPAPGTVGIAYLNAICSPRVGSGLSSILSARAPGSRAIWKVVAHEIGHNFGGEHSFELGQGRTGGIMDYGDGKLTGVYQFNTRFRRAQICQRIATTQRGQGGNTGQSTTCWSNYVTGAAKTYAFFDSTVAPTHSPCTPTCLTTQGQASSRTTIKRCYETNAQGQKTGTTAVADNLCPPPKPLGTSEACASAPGLCSATEKCGDGVVNQATAQTPETCDNGPVSNTNPAHKTDACCSATCQKLACTTASDIDACFVSIKTNKTYCFRGPTYNRYTPGSDQKDAGYPRMTKQYWDGPNDAGGAFFFDNVDAIVQRPEGRIYFMKGTEYAVYELGFGKHNGFPKAATGTTGLLGLPASWTKIEAAVSTRSGQGGAYVFNKGQYCYFGFDPAFGTQADATSGRNRKCSDLNANNPYPRPISDWNGGQAFPLGGITAARRYWDSTTATTTTSLDSAVDLMYQGKYVRYKFGQGIVASGTTGQMTRESQGFGTVAAQSPTAAGASPTTTPIVNTCSSGCQDCSANVNSCSVCEQDFNLVSGRCYAEEYVVEMLFDVNTEKNDFTFVKNKVIAGNLDWNTKEGNTGNGVVLTNADTIELDTSRIPTNMQDWEFHFWVKLSTTAASDQINMVSGSISHNGNSYEFSFFLDPCLDSFGAKQADCWLPTYQLIKASPADSFQVASPGYTVKKDQWNHLIATLERGNMKLTIEGAVVQIPFDYEGDGKATMQNSPWVFSRMEIGKNLGTGSTRKGIDGMMDQFHVDKLSEYVLDSYGSRNAHLGSLSLLFIALISVSLY